MYANLRVRVHGVLPGLAAQQPIEHRAWKVETNEAGELVVHLDANDGGSYSEPAGEITYPRGTPFTVEADF
jgi:hypothetical protein